MAKEIVSKSISNWDSTNPIQASVVVSTLDPTKNWLVVCNPDWSALGWQTLAAVLAIGNLTGQQSIQSDDGTTQVEILDTNIFNVKNIDWFTITNTFTGTGLNDLSPYFKYFWPVYSPQTITIDSNWITLMIFDSETFYWVNQWDTFVWDTSWATWIYGSQWASPWNVYNMIVTSWTFQVWESVTMTSGSWYSTGMRISELYNSPWDTYRYSSPGNFDQSYNFIEVPMTSRLENFQFQFWAATWHTIGDSREFTIAPALWTSISSNNTYTTIGDVDGVTERWLFRWVNNTEQLAWLLDKGWIYSMLDILWGAYYMNDISKWISVDIQNRRLYTNTVIAIDWSLRSMYSDSWWLSIDWEHRQMWDSSWRIVADWFSAWRFACWDIDVAVNWTIFEVDDSSQIVQTTNSWNTISALDVHNAIQSVWCNDAATWTNRIVGIHHWFMDITTNEDSAQLIVKDITDTYMGNGVVSATPANITHNATWWSGSDIWGADIIIAWGRSTGNRPWGSVYIKTSDAWLTGISLNDLNTVVECDSHRSAILAGRLQEKKGTDTASATNVTLPYDWNKFNITWTTTIKTIISIDRQVGSTIRLYFPNAIRLTNWTAANNLKLALGNDWLISSRWWNITLDLHKNGYWEEVARTEF